MDIFGKSIKGRRNANQDKIYYDQHNGSFIMVVADGIGGSFGGEEASKIVACQGKKYFEAFTKNPNPFELKSVINELYLDAVYKIKKKTLEKTELRRMGTTVTMVLGTEDKYVVGNVGDSRTYLISPSKSRQLTKDHSYINELKEKYPNEPLNDELKESLGNIITRSVNAIEDEIDIFPVDRHFYTLKPKELLLLFSDGMIINQNEFIDYWQQTDTVKIFVNQLIDNSFQQGSKDNISVIAGY